MAAIIRSDHDLPTLRITMDPTLPGSEVVFQAVRGQGPPLEAARCAMSDVLGTRARVASSDELSDYPLSLPEPVLAELRDAVVDLGPSPMAPHQALWLELPNPRGFLYAAPWERLLAPLDRCVFRLPNHLVRPQAPAHTLDVAICASSPAAKTAFDAAGIMAELAARYFTRSEHDVRIHLFTDMYWQGQLEAELARYPGLAPRVTLHDPTHAEPFPRPPRTTRLASREEVSNPWLRWMLASMEGRSLDIVHFVAHGFLSSGRGAVAVASTPTLNTDRELSRFIGSVELTTFLTQVGAWGLTLTGPPYNFSDAGLRELADSVALVLPGVHVMHRLEDDPGCEEFGTALQTFFGGHPEVDRPLPSMTMWVHPRLVEFPDADQHDLHVNVDGSSAFLAGSTVDALAGERTAAWVASASRSLEMLQARWLPDSAHEHADPAAVAALRNVAALLEEHVDRAYPRGGTSGGDE